MRTFIVLFKKELKHYLSTPFGWIIFGCISLLQAMSFTSVLEMYNKVPVEVNTLTSSFSTFIFQIYFLFLFPLITMKQFAEEERIGTLESLLTAPVTTLQVVLAKYFASLLFFCLLWVPFFMHFQVYTWVVGGELPITSSAVFGSITILLLIGSSFTAVGILVSAMTSSQIIAAILTFGVLILHLFLGYVPLIVGDSFKAAEVFHHVAMHEHLALFSQGVIDLRAVVYYLSLSVLLILGTHHLVDYRRWKH